MFLHLYTMYSVPDGIGGSGLNTFTMQAVSAGLDVSTMSSVLTTAFSAIGSRKWEIMARWKHKLWEYASL